LLWELLNILETEEEDDVVRWAYTFLTNAGVDEIWQWLRTAVPLMMTLVPSRRKASFLSGFGDAMMDSRRESPQVWNAMVVSL
jgi:hypothetical protein